MKKKHLVIVGGFLGAGKTTLIGQTVRLLQSSGLRCGVITNDQADGLVDTALADRLDGAAVSEIAGGCFCCKLDELAAVLSRNWAEGGNSAPDVIVAEPVGSCTDLMATVLLPLRKAYGESVQLSPLSVTVDGRRALASLAGRRVPGDFSKDVGYIYRKQIEEAEIVVVNKKDLMSPTDLADLLDRLAREYPGKRVHVLSARTGEGIPGWIREVMEAETRPESLMDVDYQRYGAGEAVLGWCNAEVSVSSPGASGQGIDGDDFLLALATLISDELSRRSFEVAHLKMALDDGGTRLGAVNQVMSGTLPEISRSFPGRLVEGNLTVNLRAEADPGHLRSIVEDVLQRKHYGDATVLCQLRELAAFRPGQPVPVERITAL
jgi:Ni2+-binding GTPase involved in maturation of urease and hydrogenase